MAELFSRVEPNLVVKPKLSATKRNCRAPRGRYTCPSDRWEGMHPVLDARGNRHPNAVAQIAKTKFTLPIGWPSMVSASSRALPSRLITSWQSEQNGRSGSRHACKRHSVRKRPLEIPRGFRGCLGKPRRTHLRDQGLRAVVLVCMTPARASADHDVPSLSLTHTAPGQVKNTPSGGEIEARMATVRCRIEFETALFPGGNGRLYLS